jgi:hypothetical protein
MMAQSLVFFKNYDMGEYQEKVKSRGKKRKRKIKKRQAQLVHMFKVLAEKDTNNLTDPYEGIVNPIPFAPAEPAQMGMLDGIYPKSDLEDKPVGNLGYGILETHLAEDEEIEEDDVKKKNE